MNNWKEKIPAIFAEQGDIVEVPLEAQTDSQVSFETGYTPNYERDAVDELGNPLVQYGIERTKFNYLMKVLTTAIKEVQEVIPVYTEGATDKVDVSSVITATNTFDVLESLLCIDNATGKASRITKEDIIANLNPDVNLSNDNITVSELATTAMDNFLSIDGDIIKKADKMLQSVIEEINLSADNVVISATTTFDNTDSILVTNAEGKVAKATTIPQEKIENINVSKDNISIDEYTDQEPDAAFKPIMASNSGKLYTKDTIPSEVIEGDIFATAIKYTVMTAETYPDGLDNLIQTGVYHVIDFNEYKDIINDQIDTTAREEYILSVMNDFLVELNMIKEPFTDIESLAVYAGSDFIYPYEPIIQVIGVSADATDDTKVTQVFKLNGEVKGQRTFTATTDGLTDEVWTPVTTYIRNTIEEEFISFMYNGVTDEATTDLTVLRSGKTIGYNNKEELSYGFSFGGFNCYDIVTIDTDLDWTDISDTVDSDVYIAAYRYNQSLLTIDDTKIIKLNGVIVEDANEIKKLTEAVILVNDRTHGIKYIALGKTTLGNGFHGLLFDDINAENFLNTAKVNNFFRINLHSASDLMFANFAVNFNENEIKLRNVTNTVYSQYFGVNAGTVMTNKLIVKDSSFNPVMIVDDEAITVNSTTTRVNGSMEVSGNLTADTLTVDGYIVNDDLQEKLDAKLDKVGGNISGNLTISGSTTLKGNLIVNEGTTTTISSDSVAINSPTTVNDDLTVTGNLNAGSFQLPDNFNVNDLAVGNNLTVSGHAALNGSTAINGSLTLKSNYEGGEICLAPQNTTWTDETSKKGIYIDRYKNDTLRIFTGQPVVHYASMQEGNIQLYQNTTIHGNLTVTDKIAKSFANGQAAPVLSNIFMAENPIIPTNRLGITAGLSFRFIENILKDPYLKNLYISYQKYNFYYNANNPSNSTVSRVLTTPVLISSLLDDNTNASGNVVTASGLLITFKGVDAKGTMAELLVANVFNSDAPDSVQGLQIFARLDNNMYGQTSGVDNLSINTDNNKYTSEVFTQI